MKTQDFIESNLHNSNHVEKTCSSVFTNGNGTFYSYGYHYPLLVRHGGLFFANDAGYSSSTAKHIGWAKGATGYKALVYDYRYAKDPRDTSKENIKGAVKNEIKDVNKKLKELSARAFRQKEQLENRLEELNKSLSNL